VAARQGSKVETAKHTSAEKTFPYSLREAKSSTQKSRI
jgi:hypothetical protein